MARRRCAYVQFVVACLHDVGDMCQSGFIQILVYSPWFLLSMLFANEEIIYQYKFVRGLSGWPNKCELYPTCKNWQNIFNYWNYYLNMVNIIIFIHMFCKSSYIPWLFTDNIIKTLNKSLTNPFEFFFIRKLHLVFNSLFSNLQSLICQTVLNGEYHYWIGRTEHSGRWDRKGKFTAKIPRILRCICL